ncbi:MAG: hypothetical protein OXU42_17855 [Deltaproteobacteria bacterium]|nr:hypothetical protein [Deltaproteobacteria bacterium]
MRPPDLLQFNGNWDVYEHELYRVFIDELARSGLEFRGKKIACRRIPETGGRWASFWHLVQQGHAEDERTPDLRRCERLRWIRWVIQNAGKHPEIDEWRNTRTNETNTLLWYREEYLVVLAQRQNSWLLKTAYCTDQHRRIEQLSSFRIVRKVK